MLMQKNRMDIEQDMSEWRDAVLDMGVREIARSGDIGILSTELDGLPADPADRIIVATALAHEATLVTADARNPGLARNTRQARCQNLSGET